MPQNANYYIAVDLGAESGRVMLGRVAKGRLELEPVHRFANGPVQQDDSLRWDFDRLLSDIKTGIGLAAKKAGGKIQGIGVDTWGVDFGLLGKDGKLLEKPYHYRDSRTNGMMDKAFAKMPKRQVYENTGIQFMQLNSLYQLLAMRLANSPTLAKTERLLFMADLFSYFLCGKAIGEYTMASTSQMMDMKTGQWSKAIFKELSLPLEIMPPITKPGTVVGTLTAEVAREIGCAQIPLIAIGSHDTASAVLGVPGSGDRWAYLSSGTWSLMGVELPKAIVNDKTFAYEFTNEGGVENTIRLLKNIMGLWLVQECKRQWQRDGQDLSYGELTRMAAQAKPFFGYVNCDNSDFLAPGDMPSRINQCLAETGQQPTQDKGQMVRLVLESLALKYRSVLGAIEDITGKSIDVLHIVGGGIQNELLCQFTADAIGRKVVTGPIEATASGNVLMQAKAVGQLKSIDEARQVVRNSFEMKEYKPQNRDLWDRQYKTFVRL
ncbi:MAG TPA: rhamnulokinase family protein [Sedimentisphaerales bacterium]|jgi:sugar (pentulose or hexulose) kinase|nr:rhamnulokinase family protein [Sedimentisphaerales bacterium]HNU30100.1 rhamnulokinase family protein [Sedimentisphaerales bacterium]